MREDWDSYILGDIVDLKQGFALNKKSRHYISEKETSFPLLKISDLINGTETLFVNENIPKQFLVTPDEIIYSRTGQVGLVFMGKTGVVYNNCFKVIPTEKVYSKFLYHWLKTSFVQTTIKSLATGSAQPDLNHGAFKSVKINLPPLKTQRKIASILSAYDDLIENNLKRIKLLEEQAQLTYEEWFVRFKFPGHETTKFDEDTGLPEGWDKKKLGNLIVNYDSKRVPVSKMQREKMQGKYPYYGAASIMDYVDDYLFDGRFVLMGEDGTVITNEGYPKLQFVQGKIWVNNHAHVLEGNKISNEFLYLFLNQYPIQGHVTGVAQPKINQKNLNRIKVIYATKDVRDRFDEVVKPNIDLIFNLQKQNQLLKEARDMLLPRLMSGMIDPSTSSGQVVDKLVVGNPNYEVTK